MSPAWWAAFGPAEAQLRCGDAQHRLRWADGTLQALDHPDAEGELVLGALGGDTSPCLDVVAAWGKHCDDLTVLAIGPRSASDQLTIPASVLDETPAVSVGGTLAFHSLGNPGLRLRSSGGGFIRRMPSARAVIYASRSGGSRRRPIRRILAPILNRAIALRRARMVPVSGLVHGWAGPSPWRGGFEADDGQAELIRLFALGPPFQFRLSAAVAHAWSAGGPNAGRAERARPALTAALAGRLAPAAADWLDIDPDEVEVNMHGGADWGEFALTKTGGTGRLQARLPLGWLASVWAPGFTVVDRHLIVSVLDAAWPTARVLAVRSPDQAPVEQTIRSDNGHWRVTSR